MGKIDVRGRQQKVAKGEGYADFIFFSSFCLLYSQAVPVLVVLLATNPDGKEMERVQGCFPVLYGQGQEGQDELKLNLAKDAKGNKRVAADMSTRKGSSKKVPSWKHSRAACMGL